MSSWPVRPAKNPDNAWYREIEKILVLTVISADKEESACHSCGVKRVIYQSQTYPERHIIARCKDCTVKRAGGFEKLWVRSETYLRQKWERDGKDPARSERVKKARWRAPDGGT